MPAQHLAQLTTMGGDTSARGAAELPIVWQVGELGACSTTLSIKDFVLLLLYGEAQGVTDRCPHLSDRDQER